MGPFFFRVLGRLGAVNFGSYRAGIDSCYLCRSANHQGGMGSERGSAVNSLIENSRHKAQDSHPGVQAVSSFAVTAYHNLRSLRTGPGRHRVLHTVVLTRITVEDACPFHHRISSRIRGRFDNSRNLVHREPCDGPCNGLHLLCL